ncbi:MAG: hypothetical protein WCL71_00410 [Deltaproteobacteria bacterium]
MITTQCPNATTAVAQKVTHGVGYKAATCCKTVGSGFTGKGLCLGLGLGLGVWGPIALIGIGVAGGYFYWKKASNMLD